MDKDKREGKFRMTDLQTLDTQLEGMEKKFVEKVAEWNWSLGEVIGWLEAVKFNFLSGKYEVDEE